MGSITFRSEILSGGTGCPKHNSTIDIDEQAEAFVEESLGDIRDNGDYVWYKKHDNVHNILKNINVNTKTV